MANNIIPNIAVSSSRSIGNVSYREKDPTPLREGRQIFSIPDEDTIDQYIEGNVIFSRRIYSNEEFKRRVSSEFSELSIPEQQIDLEGFFQQYNQLFYSIPKEGEISHTTLITNSTEYINGYKDPKDQIIKDLNNKIIELELQLAGGELNENPIFRNGTLIKGPDGNAHYMDQGYRRLVVFTPTFNTALKVSIYGTSDVELPLVSDTMFNNIPIGPPLTEENFGIPFTPNSLTEDISNTLLELDPQDINYNPNLYENIGEFEDALIKDLKEKQAVIDVLNERIEAINTQINNIIISDPDYTSLNTNR
jgi:hypothetical protein